MFCYNVDISSSTTALPLQLLVIKAIQHHPCQHRRSHTTTPSKETTGPAQTRKAKRYENEKSEMPNGARAAFA